MGKLLITMPDEMVKALQDIALKEDRVVAAIVRRLVAEYLAKEYDIVIDATMRRGNPHSGSTRDSDQEE